MFRARAPRSPSSCTRPAAVLLAVALAAGSAAARCDPRRPGDVAEASAAGDELAWQLSYSEGVWFTRWSPDGRDLYAQPMDETVRVLRGAPGPD